MTVTDNRPTQDHFIVRKRIEVGPLVWEVCDRVAWHTITGAWVALHRQLTGPDR